MFINDHGCPVRERHGQEDWRLQSMRLPCLLQIAKAESSGDLLCGWALMHFERESNYRGPWLLSSKAS